MASGWKRTFRNVRSFAGNSMGGLGGTSSLVSWVVAGTLAYFLWIRPAQKRARGKGGVGSTGLKSIP